MSCDYFSTAVPADVSIDDLPAVERRRALEHVRECKSCRRAALATDRSLLFAALPRVEVTDSEVEQIRSSVRVLRRAREVERSISIGRWGRRAAAVAALFVIALLLDPRRPEQLSVDSPFAGALGVGAGQLDLSSPTSTQAVVPDSTPAVEPTPTGDEDVGELESIDGTEQTDKESEDTEPDSLAPAPNNVE